MRRRAIARFRGGPWHGQEMAVPEHSTEIRVAHATGPVNPIYYTDNNWADTTPVNIDYGRYYASATGSSNITWNWAIDSTTWQGTQVYVWDQQQQGIVWPAIGSAYPALWPEIQSIMPEPLTPEEADRRLAATRAAVHRTAMRRRKAIKKGRHLLLNVLTEAQKEEYARTKSFTVMGANGRRYRLRKGGTTHELDLDGRAILTHCIHLPYSYIDEDSLVAVKLLLETDVQEFLRIANTSQIAIPSLPRQMVDRAEVIAQGMEGVNERFLRLSVAAEQARAAADRLSQALQYGDYARGLESQLVAEETGGLLLPLAARQQYTARALGHAEDSAGQEVAA